MTTTAATKTATPNTPIWQQVQGETHRWELRRPSDGKIFATVWLEGGWWHWSADGVRPERGASKVFRTATAEAESAVCAAKKGGAR
jgi:hypothetical protein